MDYQVTNLDGHSFPGDLPPPRTYLKNDTIDRMQWHRTLWMMGFTAHFSKTLLRHPSFPLPVAPGTLLLAKGGALLTRKEPLRVAAAQSSSALIDPAGKPPSHGARCGLEGAAGVGSERAVAWVGRTGNPGGHGGAGVGTQPEQATTRSPNRAQTTKELLTTARSIQPPGPGSQFCPSALVELQAYDCPPVAV